ncbi:HdeD family acid-resistance protein [Luteolibacter luteus]|uniref:HdeD family acid-resistance protein n=1 Tax=Luteolibacter luteus TaxID=2728835 RepID=A0A858RQB5_9BACT|nr:HdeD family acid-resistance protein [Luteolibacter luteus]QJE98821.1 HdeD family acid-resistance protein [Luteolibacter luteus]
MNTTLLHLLSRNWGWILLRGILAILFGLMAFGWPLLTLQVLVLLYGAYVLVDGVISLIAAIRGGTFAPRWWLALVGVIGLLAGIALFLWPGLGALALLMFIGAVAIVRGIFEIAGAVALRREIRGEWMLILSGLASILFGAVVMLFPGAGAVGMVWLIAAYSIAFGLILCVLAFRLRSHGKPRHQPA